MGEAGARRRAWHQHHPQRPSRFVDRVARSDGTGSGTSLQARVFVRHVSAAATTRPTASTGSARGRTGKAGDRTTFFYNPFRKVWVFSIRDIVGGQDRVRRYLESPEFIPGARWKDAQPVLWTMADQDDPRRPEYNVPAELYNLDCVAYESIVLGLFTIFRGERPEREKPNDICVGYSRDGFHWARPDRQRVHSGVRTRRRLELGQRPVGGRLLPGRRRPAALLRQRPQRRARQQRPGRLQHGPGDAAARRFRRRWTTATTTARSACSRALPRGTLVTRPVVFNGRFLFVNASVAGELRVEMLDKEGAVIAPYTAARCVPVRGDRTKMAVSWDGVRDLSPLAGRPVRFRFSLQRGASVRLLGQPVGVGREPRLRRRRRSRLLGRRGSWRELRTRSPAVPATCRARPCGDVGDSARGSDSPRRRAPRGRAAGA